MSIFGSLIDPIANIVGKVVPDADKARELAHEISTMAEKNEHAARLAQLEINKAEAASASVFKGGWRPFIGWTGGATLALNYLVFPLLSWGMQVTTAMTGSEINIPAPPVLDWTVMGPIITAMLGIAGARTVEKIRDVASR
jgi:hypothetical protein